MKGRYTEHLFIDSNVSRNYLAPNFPGVLLTYIIPQFTPSNSYFLSLLLLCIFCYILSFHPLCSLLSPSLYSLFSSLSFLLLSVSLSILTFTSFSFRCPFLNSQLNVLFTLFFVVPHSFYCLLPLTRIFLLFSSSFDSHSSS